MMSAVQDALLYLVTPMKIEDMTATVKRRLSQKPVCTICGKEIQTFHDIQYIKYRYGVNVYYNFFHTSCCVERAEGSIKNGD